MSTWARTKSFARSVLRRGRIEREMDAELRFHLASYTDELVRSGIPEDEARRIARMEFGSSEPVKEDCRRALGLRLIDETAQDLRYAGRMLRQSPSFTALAVLILALGIGGNSAVFSVVNDWILKPPPYPEPNQLVAIWSLDSRKDGISGVSAADLYDWRDTLGVFQDVCGWTNPLFTLTRDGEPRQLVGARVNAGFFGMLGVRPSLGRDFLPEEDQAGSRPAVLLSDGLWRDAFGADPAVIGAAVEINGEGATVVGVMPPDFHLPLMGRANLWLPLALTSAQRGNRSSRSLNVMARVRPGITVAEADHYL